MRKRQTGRSTRMLNRAIRFADDGEYVIVFCADSAHRRILMDMTTKLTVVRQIIKDQKIYLKNGGGQITFELIGDTRLDVRNGTVMGAYPSVKVLADHYALESAYSWIFAEHERYDAPPIAGRESEK